MKIHFTITYQLTSLKLLFTKIFDKKNMSEQRILREIKERIKESSTNGQIDQL